MPTGSSSSSSSSRIVIVGECPGKNNDGSAAGRQGPLDGPSGQRLAGLCGIALQEFLDLYERCNLFQQHVPYARWNYRGAEKAADELQRSHEGRRFVLLGRHVGKAFLAEQSDFFDWSQDELVVCPHPSGMSRWWNDADNVEAARRFWLETTSHESLL